MSRLPDTLASTGKQAASSSRMPAERFNVAEPADSATVSETDLEGKTPAFVSYAAQEDLDQDGLKKVVKKSSITTVIVAGIALFSDGYIVQIGKCNCCRLSGSHCRTDLLYSRLHGVDL